MFVHCTHLFHHSQFTSHSNIAKHPGPWCRGHVRSAASPAYDSFHAKLNHLQISSTIPHISTQKAWKTQSRNARATCTLLSLFTSYRVISRHSNLIFDADITFTICIPVAHCPHPKSCCRCLRARCLPSWWPPEPLWTSALGVTTATATATTGWAW